MAWVKCRYSWSCCHPNQMKVRMDLYGGDKAVKGEFRDLLVILSYEYTSQERGTSGCSWHDSSTSTIRLEFSLFSTVRVEAWQDTSLQTKIQNLTSIVRINDDVEWWWWRWVRVRSLVIVVDVQFVFVVVVQVSCGRRRFLLTLSFLTPHKYIIDNEQG